MLTCPVQVHFRLLTCSVTSVTCVFFLTQMFVFLFRYVMFNILLSSLFVRLLACSLFDWWVPMFPCRVAFLEVRMSCRLVSSSIFQCYSWRCRGAWRMLSIRPWFFFESPCLGFCLWCCISVAGRCSFQRPRSKCRFPSSHLYWTCSSLDPAFNCHQLIPVAFLVVPMLY